jgi:hypothetical protein
MGNGGTTVDRLREFLRGLTSEARAKLIAELERRVLRGEHDAATDLILTELRQMMRENREGTPRQNAASRLFFKLFEPFLVDDVPARRHPGRLTRSSLQTIWSFLQRDLAPDDVAEFETAALAALGAGDNAKAEIAARKLQDAVALALETGLGNADDRERRRLIAQIGTPRAEEDGINLMRIFQMRDPLAMLADHLPNYVANFSDTRLTETRSLLASATTRHPDILPYAALLVMRRLNEFWQLVRLAPPASKGVIDSSYGGVVSIVLAELARRIEELRESLHGNGAPIASLVQNIHNAVRGLRIELNPPTDSPCGRELATLRRQVSELLQSEIEAMPGRVRRLLRARPSAEIRPDTVLDPAEVAETEAAITLVAACRNFAGELALNEATQRSYGDVQQYLENGVDALMNSLRHAGDNDRTFRESQVDAAIRFCGKLFGPDYAAMLTKARNAAAAVERRPQQAGA